MIKSLLPAILVATLISCHSKKTISTTVVPQDHQYLKSEFYFDNCDDLTNFLKSIIITNKSDTTLKKNYFRISHIKSSYEFAKNIFQEKCFIGISVDELDEIFGERAVLVTQEGKVVTTSTGSYSDWYYLESENIKLAFDIFINNNIVTRFKIGPNAKDNTLRIKKD